MADIFGRTNTGFGGAFKSSLAQINISGGAAGAALNKMLITNLTAAYTQSISRIYEIASDKAYFVVGRPAGQGSFGSVFGPKKYSQAVYERLADPCQTNNIDFKFAKDASCDEQGNPTGRGWGRRLTHVVLQSLNFNVNAQDMLINENIAFQFATLEVI